MAGRAAACHPALLTQADARFSLGGLGALIALGHWKGLSGREVTLGFTSQPLTLLCPRPALLGTPAWGSSS